MFLLIFATLATFVTSAAFTASQFADSTEAAAAVVALIIAMAATTVIHLVVVMMLMLTALPIMPLRLVMHNCYGMHDTRNDTTDGEDNIEGELLIPVGTLCGFAQASNS